MGGVQVVVGNDIVTDLDIRLPQLPRHCPSDDDDQHRYDTFHGTYASWFPAPK